MAQLGQGFERKDSTLHGIQQQRCRSNYERKGTMEQATDKKEAAKITVDNVFKMDNSWIPEI